MPDNPQACPWLRHTCFAGGPSEQVQMELVQLCTTLIQHAHTLFQEHRKELIQFGWWVGRLFGCALCCTAAAPRERGSMCPTRCSTPSRWTLKYDNIAKPFAFLCVAHFFRAFPTPEKIMLQVRCEGGAPRACITVVRRTGRADAHRALGHGVSQVYVALCRLSQSTDPVAKEAVRKGIDIMIPNLARAAASEVPGAGVSGPQAAVEAAGEPAASKDSTASGLATSGAPALGAGAAQSGSSPSYARYLKRVLSEDGHVSITLVHLLQVIVRNRDMFYQSRCVDACTCVPRGRPRAAA